jgi:hypothetical protein
MKTKTYKIISAALAVMFAVVGFLFLLLPDGVLEFFNSLSRRIGMTQAPLNGMGFYLILASGYMYLVTLLAFFMYRYPENRHFPLLLANGKLASSILSLYMFLSHQPYLVCLVNFLVDGFIGIIVMIFFFRLKKMTNKSVKG